MEYNNNYNNNNNISDIDDEEMFSSLLSSMGINNWDSDALVALSEYAKRLTAEILCDAKDFSTHANRNEITIEDISLAVKLSDSLLSRIDYRTRILHESCNSINTRNLMLALPKQPLDNKYINELTNRTFTYTTAIDAYGEENITHDEMEIDNK